MRLILQPFRCFTYDIGTSPTSPLILQPFRCFTYVTAHYTALPLLHLRHRHFTYITAHSPILRDSSLYSPFVASPTSQALHLRHSLFSNTSAALPKPQLILQPFRRFIYATAHSTARPPLHLRHRSFYNLSVASPTSQAIHVLHLASRPCKGG